MTENLYELFYTDDSQEHISIAGYWKDPRVPEYSLYLQFSKFLADINNDTDPR